MHGEVGQMECLGKHWVSFPEGRELSGKVKKQDFTRALADAIQSNVLFFADCGGIASLKDFIVKKRPTGLLTYLAV
jgi:hypothetical protein